MTSSVAPATVAGKEGSSSEVGTAPQSSKHAKRYGEQEGSEAELVEELVTCWSVRGRPARLGGFCDGAARRRRLQRRRWCAGGVWTRSWRRGGGLGGDGGPSPPLYTRVAGVGANAIILSPLSLCGSHQRWLTQVVSWVVRGGGE